MGAQAFLSHHRQASQTAFDALVHLLCDRHAAALYRLALTLVGDPDLAERVVVDALAAAVRTRATATRTTSPRRFVEDRVELVDAVYRRCFGAHDRDEALVEPCDKDQRAMIGVIVFGARSRDPNTRALTTPEPTRTPADSGST